MANEEMSAQLIDAIASNAMGVPPQTPQEAAPEPKKETTEGQAAEAGSPETEGDKMVAEAVVYEIDFGEGKSRNLTPEQIKSTFNRYRDLNYKNAQMKPVNDVIEGIMKANPGLNPQQLAEQMVAVMRAQESNPTMGNTDGQQQQKPSQPPVNDLDSTLSKYEEDNAVALPPGYKDLLLASQNSSNQMGDRMTSIENMLRQMIANTSGVADAARASLSEARSNNINAIQKQIANNLDNAQRAANLPDDAAQDFMMFAAERGYTMEDFADMGLTMAVVKDFSNLRNSGEMETLRSMAQRRKAYTGSLGGSTPSAAGTDPAPSDNTFDRFASSVMSSRGLG